MFILSKNKMLTKFAQAYGIRFGAGRFVAGETLTEAVKTVKRLNQKGLSASIDYLGEYAGSEKDAKRTAEECKKQSGRLPRINWIVSCR